MAEFRQDNTAVSTTNFIARAAAGTPMACKVTAKGESPEWIWSQGTIIRIRVIETT